MEKQNDTTEKTRQYATFTLGEFLFGIDVHEVQEISRYQELTAVPLASSEVRGLMNLRGQIITAIDLRRLLKLAEKNDTPMNVIVQTPSEVVSLLVDDIGDVIDVDTDRFEPTPEIIGSSLKQLVEGVYKLDGKLLLIFSTKSALTPQRH